MANPYILADNRFLDGTPIAAGTASGYSVLNIRDLKTFTKWKDSAAGSARYIKVDCGTPKAADTVALVGHNFGSAGALFDVEYSNDGVSYTQILAPVYPSDDKALIRTFTKTTARYWYFGYGSTTSPVEIAELMIGERITFPYPPDTPFVPSTLKIEADSNRSKTGQLLGTVVRYKPYKIAPKWSSLSRTWVDATFRPFWEGYASELKPFFWAWDVATFPSDVRFVTIDPESSMETPVTVLSSYDELSLEMVGVKE